MNKPVVGILHFGDLGTAVARVLVENGTRVVTCCKDRSAQTRARAAATGAKILPTFEDFVRQANVVVSLVLPSAAVEVATHYAELADLRPSDSVFVDVNSIDLATLHEIESRLAAKQVDFVDAAIHGGAKRLRELAILYVSGPRASDIARIFSGCIEVNHIGDCIGQATGMKLLLGGLSKSLNALFLEIAAVANHAGMAAPFRESCHYFYPGLMSAIERMLPTYPQHAARRVDELGAVADLASTHGAHADMVSAAREVISRFADIDTIGEPLSGDASDLPRIIELAATAQATTNNNPE